MAGDGDGSDDDDGDGGGGEGSSETGTLASTVAMGSGGSSITAYTNDLEYLDDMFQLIATKIKFHQLDSQVRARARACVCVCACVCERWHFVPTTNISAPVLLPPLTAPHLHLITHRQDEENVTAFRGYNERPPEVKARETESKMRMLQSKAGWEGCVCVCERVVLETATRVWPGGFFTDFI